MTPIPMKHKEVPKTRTSQRQGQAAPVQVTSVVLPVVMAWGVRGPKASKLTAEVAVAATLVVAVVSAVRPGTRVPVQVRPAHRGMTPSHKTPNTRRRLNRLLSAQ